MNVLCDLPQRRGRGESIGVGVVLNHDEHGLGAFEDGGETGEASRRRDSAHHQAAVSMNALGLRWFDDFTVFPLRSVYLGNPSFLTRFVTRARGGPEM